MIKFLSAGTYSNGNQLVSELQVSFIIVCYAFNHTSTIKLKTGRGYWLSWILSYCSQTCLKGHLHITNQSIKSSFVFSIYWIMHIIWTCVYKGHQFIKGTFSSSLSCPLYTSLTVFEIQDGWFYWIYCIVAYVQSIFVAIFLSVRYKRSKDLQ